MVSHPARGIAAAKDAEAGEEIPGKQPEPGPAPSGPAIHGPKQTPASTPTDPGAAPSGPAIHPKGK